MVNRHYLNHNYLPHFLIILLLLLSLPNPLVSSVEEEDLSFWNNNWSFRQELRIPIKTDNPYAIFQPIDMEIQFPHECWAKDMENHSIRVCCWDGVSWHELDCQIYQLEHNGDEIISNCRVIFLIPAYATGEERYFIYYDESKTSQPNYADHVKIKDAYYYYEPISGLSVEGDYFKIIDDDCTIYAVGQKGEVMNRGLSQCVIKMKPGTTDFDITNSELLTSFAFAYQKGDEDSDEVSSDEQLVSKEVITDGNLMVEFGIMSESHDKSLLTTNVYKYYHCPHPNKRISVRVKHEALTAGYVQGLENIDGRFGTIISYKSKSAAIKKMTFGFILPFIHVFGENNRIREYNLILDPEGKERDWVISFQDDCDLGNDAWISYDEGSSGRCHGILFSSNTDLITQGVDENDGIEIKVAEREYINIFGTEVDYVSIAFGRNAYEKGQSHDLEIPKGLIVEYDAEFFNVLEGSYVDIAEEGKLYRILAKQRYQAQDGLHGDEGILTLTVIPHVSGRIISYPYLVRTFNISLPVIWIELYQNDTLVTSGIAHKPFVGLQGIRFPKLKPGEYIIKIYRKIGTRIKNYIGMGFATIHEDTAVHIYCTWQKSIEVISKNQHNRWIEDIVFILLKDDLVVTRNTSDSFNRTVLKAPFNLFESYTLSTGISRNITMFNIPFNRSAPYILQGFYKGFRIYSKELSPLQNVVNINLTLHSLIIEIEDALGFSPGVDVKPILTSPEMFFHTELLPEYLGNGKYLFDNLPVSTYDLQISFGTFSDSKTISIPQIGEYLVMNFSAQYDLQTELFNSQGESLSGDNFKIDVIRTGKTIYHSLSHSQKITLPPGKYTINAHNGNTLIGSKTIEFTNERSIKIVTKIRPLWPFIVEVGVIVFIGILLVYFLFNKLSLNSLLKLSAMALIIASLAYPWWLLSGSHPDLSIEKTTVMYIFPRTMIDTTLYSGKIQLDLANIPEAFTDFLGVLVGIIFTGLVLIGISFVPNIVLRRRFSLGLIVASIFFIIIVAAAFTFGMNTICEISLGSLQGEAILDTPIPSGETVYLPSQWGLGLGFFLFIFSAGLLITTGSIDIIRQRKIRIHVDNKNKL